MALARRQILKQLETQLSSLRANGSCPADAIEANLALVRSLKTPLSFARWVARARHLNRRALLEINELVDDWDEPIHRLLVRVERRQSLGLLQPLVGRLTDLARGRDQLTILDIGAGAMELERQLIQQIRRRAPQCRLTIIALEPSTAARQQAMNSIQSLGHNVCVQEVGVQQLPELLPHNNGATDHHIWLCNATADALPARPHRSADVALHCFVRHHLNDDQKLKVDEACRHAAPLRIEYDGYRHWAHLLSLSLLCWHHPAFHAAAVFSYYRYPTIAETKLRGQRVRRYENGCYLAESRAN